MKRCYFIGMPSVFDKDLMNQLSSHCEALVQQEDEIEFWFFGYVGDSFAASCLALVVGLKSEYPEKDLKVVRVYDPVDKYEPCDWYRQVNDTRFPCYLVDRYMYAPLMDEGIAKVEGRYAQQASKVERWILRQMDIVYAYYYPNLEDSVITQIEFAQKYCEAEVIHVYDEETEQFIQNAADGLFDERTSKILSMLKEGVTQREISKAVGVSTSRIGQIARKAARTIHYELMRRYGGAIVFNKKRSCALVGLNAESNAFQLVAFESLLEYLINYYQVNEFWIDEKSCNTTFSAILAKHCSGIPSHGATVKVVVKLSEDEVDAWDRCIRSYVPPFGSVINLGIESLDEQAFCEELVRQCSCIVTDFSGSQAGMMKELCAKAGNKYLFDISRNSFSIEEYAE